MRIHTLLLLLMLPYSELLIAQETPLSIYRATIANSSAYQASAAGLRAEQESEAIAFGQLLPNLSASANYARNETERTVANAQPEQFNYDSNAYNLTLRQPLYRRTLAANYEQAKHSVKEAEARFRLSTTEIISKAFGAYFEAMLAEDVCSYVRTQKKLAETMLQAAEKGFIAGTGTRIEIEEARSRLEIITAQEIEANNNLDNALRTLGLYIGAPPQKLAAILPERLSSVHTERKILSHWLTLAEQSNPEITAAKSRVNAAKAELEKASSGHYPTADLVINSSKNGNDSLATLNRAGDVRYRQNTFGIQINIPLFAGGQISASVRQALAKLEQSEFSEEETRRTVDLKIRREFNNLHSGMKKTAALEQAVKSAEQTLFATKKGVQAGVRTTLDVLQADQQLFQAKRDLAQSRYQLLQAKVQLLALTGTLGEPEIQELDTLFSKTK